MAMAEESNTPVIIKNLSSLQPIATIKTKLNPSQLQRFHSSCFGRLLLLSPADLRFSAQIIHFLLLLTHPHLRHDELWFRLGNQPIRFSLFEFALITGLRCGAMPTTTTAGGGGTRLKDKYFGGQKTVTLKGLELKFVSCADEEDAFRLSLVYFLLAVLLSRGETTKIDLKWLALADDLESFDKYPWGRLCYDVTLGYLKRHVMAMGRRRGLGKQERRYKLGGFPYAFQVWAYEAVPVLGRKYAVKRGDSIPRILRWETPPSVGCKGIRETVFGSRNLDALKTLRATELESEQEYTKSIANANYALEGGDGEDVGSMPSDGFEKSHDSAETSTAPKLYRCVTTNHFAPMLVINLSSLNAVQIIKGKLNPSQYERFEASCFGKLFRLPTNIKLSRTILHQLFFSQVDHPVENEIWFVIGDKPARFSQYEFALITGLNCGQYPTSTELKSTTQSTRLRDKYFNGRDMVITRSLEQQFLSCTDEDDTFKLAMVYFLETVLIGRPRNDSIDQRWLALVDDLEAFNNFVWGKLSYERTLFSFKFSARPRFGHDKRYKVHKNCYKFHGFPYVLQVWAYEAMSLVASKYAEKKANLIPRVLRWECKESANYIEIDKNVFSVENEEVLKKLGASEFESNQDYMKSIVEFTRTLEENDNNLDGTMQHYEIDDYDLSSFSTRSIFRPMVVKRNQKRVRSEKNDVEKRSEIMAAISWVRGNGKRTTQNRRKTESYTGFSRSVRLKYKSLVTEETGTRDVDDLLESVKGISWSTGSGKRTSRKRRKMDSSTCVTENLSHVLAAKDSGDQSLNSYPLSMDLIEQLDAVLQQELDLDFPGEEPTQPEDDPPATSTNRSHVDTDVIELSDDDDHKTR